MDDFYIGWQDEMPAPTRSFLKRIIIGLLVSLPLLCLLVVLFQKPFNDHQFELGNVKNISGVYFDEPVPMLLAEEGQLPEGFSNAILLVGFGKMGAELTMEAIQEKSGSLVGKSITLAGTLIYGDGKTIMELTPKEMALVDVSDTGILAPPKQLPASKLAGEGEIVDPKCYFGVMKPGEGKIHKSCAIRCLSGGIPPVFKQATGEGSYEYYIVLDTKGQKINKQLLPFVGSQIKINGQSSQFFDWKVVYIDANHMPLHLLQLSDMCSYTSPQTDL
jgi:hypothetical protein